MKLAFPVVFHKASEGGYAAYVPDFDINTQGEDLAQAIAMSRDAIGLMGIDLEDDGKEIPKPSEPGQVSCREGEIVSMVDIDFMEYRRAHERRTVRRNVSLPAWLDMQAEKAGINVSALLQAALKQELGLMEPK